jgi:hypothetical protein
MKLLVEPSPGGRSARGSSGKVPYTELCLERTIGVRMYDRCALGSIHNAEFLTVPAEFAVGASPNKEPHLPARPAG